MHLSEIRLTFQTLEQAMNLPPYVKIVAVQEEDVQGQLKIRVVSDTPPPEEYHLNHLSMVGDAYRYPEKYKAQPPQTRGGFPDTNSGSGGEAEVEVVKAPQE